MALTDYDKKNLTAEQQKGVQSATDRWLAAQAKGDTKGMEQARADAEAIRNNAGYKTDATGNYTSKVNASSSTSSGNSPYAQVSYTPKGTHNDSGLPPEALAQIEIYKKNYNDAIAMGNTEAAKQAHDAAEALRAIYGYSGGGDGSEYIALENAFNSQEIADWDYNQVKPTYTGKYDAKMDALLNAILSRKDFSYDVANDPLYQQYANMYRREGDRAMKETMAEAAAGAGGMNTYAITAAQQAQNYYNSQLNDRIPELYQLAYEMYLQDKESKVQDLGLLQSMDATQYGRYRDTMSDWKDDRNFSYGLYQDALAQNNWQTTFDYNKSVDDRNFDYKDKEWSAYEQEIAKNDVWKLIELGQTPSADLIAKAGMTQADVDLAVAAVKAQETKNTTPTKNPTKYDDEIGWDGDDTDGIKAELARCQTNDELNELLNEEVAAGNITESEAVQLYLEYEKEENNSTASTSYKDKQYEFEDDGGYNWLGGIDENAKVKYKDENGTYQIMTMEELYNELIKEGMSKSEAKAWVVDLQKKLGLTK